MRFQEANEKNTSQLDFVPRERRNQGPRLAMTFVAIFFLILTIGYSSSFSVHSVATPVLAVLVLILGFYVVTRFQQNLDLVMSTEFQMMLFSQAVALGTNFTLFARRDGTVVYTSSGLRDLFGRGSGDSQALEMIFKEGQVAMADRERVMGAIYSNVAERLIFPITMPSGQQKNYVLSVEPISRPNGYVVIRGREYRGERTGSQVMPDMLRGTTLAKLDHLLSTTPIGHYATDAFGRFEYVNQALEHMLGYQPGEIVAQRLTLPRILYQLDQRPVADDYTLADYSGEAVVQGKSRATSNCMLFQTVMRDEKGKTTGVSGSVIAAAALQ